MYDTIEKTITASDVDLLNRAEKVLNNYYKEVYRFGNYFVYAVGEVPMCLVAHVDTVRAKQDCPIVLEKNRNIIRNKKGILGADDRAGVFVVYQVIKKARRKPSVLITNYEETGCVGVKAWLDADAWSGRDTLFIGLDRHGCSEYVHYNGVLPKEVKQYVEGFGFVEKVGSISDIRHISAEYYIPSVNLSVGFYNEHSPSECLHIDEMWLTIQRVRKMVEDPFTEYVEYGRTRANTGYGPTYAGTWSFEDIWSVEECPFEKRGYVDPSICVDCSWWDDVEQRCDYYWEELLENTCDISVSMQ